VLPDSQILLRLEAELADAVQDAEFADAAQAQATRRVAAAETEMTRLREEHDGFDDGAREHRRLHAEQARTRIEAERQLNAAFEREAFAVAGREQAEQRAAGLRAAQRFAASNRAAAEAKGDHEGADRERQVEASADRQAAEHEHHAADAASEAERAAVHRADLELRVRDERDLEARLGDERDASDAGASSAREALKFAQDEREAARTESKNCEARVNDAQLRRSLAEARFRDACGALRVDVEGRLAVVHADEAVLQSRRSELERLMALLDAGGPMSGWRDFEPLPELPPGTLPGTAVANGGNAAKSGIAGTLFSIFSTRRSPDGA
jgi:hypothetical protein